MKYSAHLATSLAVEFLTVGKGYAQVEYLRFLTSQYLRLNSHWPEEQQWNIYTIPPCLSKYVYYLCLISSFFYLYIHLFGCSEIGSRAPPPIGPILRFIIYGTPPPPPLLFMGMYCVTVICGRQSFQHFEIISLQFLLQMKLDVNVS